MTTTENVRAHLAPEAGEGASAYVDPLDIGDAILEVYDDHEPRIASLEASGNVGTSDLADSAVTTAKIADSAVTSAKIADSAVTSAKIADGTIVTGDLADSAVTSAKIADGTIATGDLADSAVTSAKIAAGTIVSSDLATSAVATSNIADSAVTSAKIADGTIVAGDLADGAVTSAKILDGTIATADLADGAVTSAKIADGTIATGDLADSAVTSAKIADGTIVNADVNASAAIDVAKLSGVVASANAGNLLDYASATLDTSTGFWQGSASTLAVNTSDPYAGVGCLEATATGSAQFYVSASKTVQVTPGQPYTLTYAAKSATRNLQVYFTWTNAVGGTVLDQGITKGACASWTVFSDTRVAPAGATCVAVHFYAMTAGSAGDTLLLDRIGLWAGAGGLWAPPGTPIANLGTYTDETVGRRIFTWDTANNRWQMTYGDTGWREILTFDAAGTVTRGAFHANNHWGPLAGSSGYVRVRRSGGMLRFSVRSIAATLSANYAATAVTVLPSGFEFGSSDDGCPVVATPAGTAAARKGALVSGSYSLNVLAITQPGAAGDYLGMQSFGVPCDTAWPTSLPGIAVGTIPQ